MKRWAIFTVIAVIVSVFLVSSYAGVNINSTVPLAGLSMSQSSSREAIQPAATARSAYAMPTYGAPPLDPNVVYAAIKAYPGLDKELAQVGRGSRTEVTEWRRLQESLTSATAVDSRTRMTREVQKQVALELGFLRKIAEEGAKKTIAAIDGVLLYRQSRLEKLNKQMQEDRREAKADTSSTRSSRTRRSRTGETSTGTAEEETTSGSTRRRR